MMVLKVIALIVVVAIAAVLLLASRKPDEFRVTRSTVVNASPEAVFEQVNDLEKGHQWSPWVEMEPDAAYRFEGPKAGVDAKTHWEGKKVGKGTMTIVESHEPVLVRSRLEFFKPMTSTSTAEFQLEPDGSQTKVIWSMYGPNNFT